MSSSAPSGASTPAQLAFEAIGVEQLASTLAIYVAIRMGTLPADPTLAAQQIQQFIAEGAMVVKSLLVFFETGNRLAVDDKGFLQGFPLPTGTPAAFQAPAQAPAAG